MNFDNFLISMYACRDARDWARNKSWREIYDTCERADWLLWLFKRTNPDDKRVRVLVAGHIANTLRHLMSDKRSSNAVDVCLYYGNGQATEDELHSAWHSAWSAAWNASVDSARTAAGAAVRTASWFAARASAGDAAWDATLKSQCDIVRKYIPFEMFNKQWED